MMRTHYGRLLMKLTETRSGFVKMIANRGVPINVDSENLKDCCSENA